MIFEEYQENYELTSLHDFDRFDFLWFDNPVNHYDLASIDCRVSSFEQLQYYAEVFLYLNPDITRRFFRSMFLYFGSRDSGMSIRTYGKERVEQMIDLAYDVRKQPYCRRKRRILFNPEVIFSENEKQEIAGIVTTRGLTFSLSDILQVCNDFERRQIKITNRLISKELHCSEKTVSRLLDAQTKNLIKNINKRVRREKQISSCIEYIDLLSDSGDKVKMTSLKDITSIRDYSILKEAMLRFERGF